MNRISPLRIEGPRASHCCSWPTVLVQSMEGGFVTANCTRCGGKDYLSEYDFFYLLRCAVDCPRCGDRMHKSYCGKNYGFECPSCRNRVLLADIVPWWFDIAPLKHRLLMARSA